MYTINLATGTVIRNSDGVQVEPTGNLQNPDTQGYYAWLGEGNLPTEINVPVTDDKPRIKVGAFRERLGETAKIRIEMASVHNPNDPPEKQVLAAKLRVYKDDLLNYTHIDLSRPDVMAGLEQLKAVGIIGQPDIDRVFALPFLEEELHHG